MNINQKIAKIPFWILFGILSFLVLWDFLFTYFTLKNNPSRGEKQSSFARESFQTNEKEFFRRLISEVGPEISGAIIPWGYSGPITVRGRLSEQIIAEEFEKWK